MNFQTAVRTCLQKYTVFQGRASRSEYWFFYLFLFLAYVVSQLADRIVGTNFELRGHPLTFGYLFIITIFALVLPTLAVSVRRLHDLNRSGWWYLIAFVPFIGQIIMFVWYCFKGTNGWNDFGPDPFELQKRMSNHP